MLLVSNLLSGMRHHMGVVDDTTLIEEGKFTIVCAMGQPSGVVIGLVAGKFCGESAWRYGIPVDAIVAVVLVSFLAIAISEVVGILL